MSIKLIKDAIHVELVKIRSTVSFELAILYPLIPVLIYGMVMFHFQEKIDEKKIDTWVFFSNIVWNFWSSFALLPLVGLQTIIINNLENNNNGWRNLFSLSIPRKSIYLAKIIIIILLLSISLCLLSLYVFIYGEIAAIFFKSLRFDQTPPPYFLIYRPFLVLLGSLGVIAIHYFFSVFQKNIYISFGFVIFVTITGLFLIQKENIAIFSPWGWPALSSTYSSTFQGNSAHHGINAIIYSVITFFAVVFIGCMAEKRLNNMAS